MEGNGHLSIFVRSSVVVSSSFILLHIRFNPAAKTDCPRRNHSRLHFGFGFMRTSVQNATSTHTNDDGRQGMSVHSFAIGYSLFSFRLRLCHAQPLKKTTNESSWISTWLSRVTTSRTLSDALAISFARYVNRRRRIEALICADSSPKCGYVWNWWRPVSINSWSSSNSQFLNRFLVNWLFR